MELQDYLRILRRHWAAIILFSIAGVAGAAGWALLQEPRYTADSSGIIAASFSDDSMGNSLGAAISTQSLATSAVRTYVGLGQTRNVAQYAIDTLGLETSAAALVGSVSVSSPADTAIITAVATASSPELARDIADAWIEGIASEITRIQGSGPSVVALMPTTSAALPSTPTSPNVRLALALGLLVGFALGVAYAVVRSVLDRRVRSKAQIEAFQVPVIGVVPHLESLRLSSLLLEASAGGDPRTAGDLRILDESIRKLRTSLRYMNIDNPPRIIVVTSALPAEGKSTITANLAIALASAGENVLLIDGDLRRPRVASIFGVPGDVGLTDILVQNVQLEDAAVSWGTTGRLAILPAGDVPPNPSEILGSATMSKLITRIAEHAMIIVDAPPLLPVTDAAVLAARPDAGVLFVARAGRTTVETLEESFDSLRIANIQILGAVLNDAPVRGADASQYSKQQYYGYYAGRAGPSRL